ncbi:MAG: 2-oxoglutarate dehydrogenase E1 component [Phycisphaerales bacterium]|nr:2-oxoglutarate dehydrogenase E1 component [Phycisphaerales bacterium]
MSQSPNSLSIAFAEELYQSYVRDPASVPEDWRTYFDRYAPRDGSADVPLGPTFRPTSIFNPPTDAGADFVSGAALFGGARPADIAFLQDRVGMMIRNYRVRGHLIAALDPLGLEQPEPAELDPAHYGFTEQDMERPFSALSLGGAPPVLTLRQIIERVRNTYCRSIGVQYMHIDDMVVRNWLQERMEATENRTTLAREEQLRILMRLTDAVIFEQFIQKKFLGAKSFSLEGGETLIPLLEIAIEHAGSQGLKGVMIGMAHRGRLNVLANFMGKSPERIFREFEDQAAHLHLGRGDVKYHLGYSNDWKCSNGQVVHLSLCFNPSHLEYVNPVAMGRMRANQDRVGDEARELGMTLMIHGDAAFIGEGVVQETLNMSQLPGYQTGGALHVIVNNQIGFTTPPASARSSRYASAIGKMLQIPIFHVNGEDPEAVAAVVRLAMDFRKTFRRDVIVDMYCYRRRGHNETDEPSFTQPVMYRAIAKRPPIRESYLEHLLKLGNVTREEADQLVELRRAHLERDLQKARTSEEPPRRGPHVLRRAWQGLAGGADAEAPDVQTGVPRRKLSELLTALATLPADFHPHPKLLPLLERRREMAAGTAPLDWAAGEALAMASLAAEGVPVRLSGQDAGRGTFSHRHGVLHDHQDGHTYIPLNHVAPRQGRVEIYDSPLSETGPLGFEYGYSLDYPEALVMWEAQFGDFVNCAQVIIDQFITSAEVKWNRLCGLVMLLPHGFEGQGPEHSSARLERFLQLAADDNIQVIQPSTPAQMFHALRRQVRRPWRKPLVVMTPKSMLRHPQAVSTLADLESGTFQRFIGDANITDRRSASAISRVLLCSGKLYWELLKERTTSRRDDVAIIRMEQYYPLREDALRDVLAPYADGTPVVWVQDEPENMGAWRYLLRSFSATLFGRFPFSGAYRPASASPATGSKGAHEIEHELLLNTAFGVAQRPAAAGAPRGKPRAAPKAGAGNGAPARRSKAGSGRLVRGRGRR